MWRRGENVVRNYTKSGVGTSEWSRQIVALGIMKRDTDKKRDGDKNKELVLLDN